MSHDIPSISELEAIQLLNKHYAEVITSKKDGIASGSDITRTTNPITGVTRRTLYKILDDMDVEHDAQMQSFENDFDGRLAGMAFTRVGTFTAGATLTDMRQTLLWEVSHGGDGHEYGWSGTFPKAVTAGSAPSPIASGAWVDRTDDSLRSDLAGTNSTVLVGGVKAGDLIFPISTISDLLTAPKIANRIYKVTSYHAGWAASNQAPQGGGNFVWDKSRSRSDHNGVTVIDPSKAFPTSWSDEAQKDDWYFSQNAGTGCFVRVDFDEVTSFMAGCFSDERNDDTKATQAGVNTAITERMSYRLQRSKGGSLGSTRISSKILINGQVRIHGDGFAYSGFICINTDCFEIAAGVKNVSMENFYIGQAIRYSITPNNYRAIRTLGTTSSRNFWHNYDRLFIDGFYLPFDVSYLWSTTFTKISTVYCFGGIYASGLSVNNTVSDCLLVGSKAAGSAGVKIGDGTIATEGWLIDRCLIAEFAIGVHGVGCSNSHVTNCIIDFFQEYGVFLQSSGTAGALNWTVSDNYMATDSKAGSCGVRMMDNFAGSSNQNRGHTVHNNQILKYSGASLAYGILQDGSAENVNIITDNKVDASTYACRIVTGAGAIVSNNHWKAGIFESEVSVSYANNRGTVVTTAAFTPPRGTFTPVVFGTTTAGTATYTSQNGYYKIVDGICHFTLRVVWTAHTGTGNMRISGLPRAVWNDANLTPALSILVENLTFPAGASSIVGFIQQNTNVIELRGAGSDLAPVPVAMDSKGTLFISGSYEVS